METTDMKELENIQIPKGLEDRLSMKIDEWERNEKRRSARQWRTVISVAASLLLIAGIGWTFLRPSENLGTKDTYSDPQQAYEEANKALELLAVNLNKGFEALNEAYNNEK
ncbi:MAG: hypothetical protein MJZ20_04640 [Bacteroidaceae bacterium]|nr:hypothetical protein [Bacteroidaceae bacterium]